MKAWDKVGLNEFKRKVREGKAHLDSDYGQMDISDIKETLNYVLVWLAELEETKEKKK